MHGIEIDSRKAPAALDFIWLGYIRFFVRWEGGERGEGWGRGAGDLVASCAGGNVTSVSLFSLSPPAQL